MEKCKSYLFIIVTASILFFDQTVFCTDYYVSPTGDDKNSGASQDQAWKSIDQVNRIVFKPGDRILFEGGQTFNGSLTFNADDAGTSENPVTISSYSTERAIINSGSKKGFYGNNCAGFVIKNLNFIGSGRLDPAGSSGIVFFTDRSDGVKLEYIRIDSVEVINFRQSGIEIGANHSSKSGFKNVRITNAIVHDCGDKGISSYGYWPPDPSNRSHQDFYIGYCKVYNITGIAEKNKHTGNGIIISSVDRVIIEYCEAYNNGELNSGSKGGPIGIWAWEANNVTIQFCESHHNKTNNGKDGGGFDLDGGCVDCIMQYNYSHDNHGAGYGIYQFSGASAFKNNVVRYNISENDGLVGNYGAINFWSTNSSGGIQNTKVYNNTLYVSSNTTGAGIVDFAFGSANVHNTEIYNNIFVTAANKKVINIPLSTGGWSFKGNCYWTYGDHIQIVWEGKTYTSISEWRNATNQEMLNGAPVGFEVDPKLVNPGSGGTIGDPTQLETLAAYKLQHDSPVIDKGLDLELLFGIDVGLHDFYGISLPQFAGFDIGAHESETFSSIKLSNHIIPPKSELENNYPNPFNQTTIIPFKLSNTSLIKLAVYNTLGQEITLLVNEFYAPGNYSILWDGRDNSGQLVTSGIYYSKLDLATEMKTIKMTIIK